MNRHRARSGSRKALLGMAASWLALCLLSACEAPNPPETSSPTALTPTIVSTVVPHPTPTAHVRFGPLLDPTPDGEAYATQYAQADPRRTTAVATPPHTASPSATLTPGPTSTPELGWGLCPASRHARDISYSSCWLGLLNGRYVRVDAGRDFGEAGTLNASQGIVRVDERVFRTPLLVGYVQIAAVEGTRAILVPSSPEAPNIEFVFDFERRVWVPPGIGPDTPLSPEWVECPPSNSLPTRYYYSCWRGKVSSASGGQDVGLSAGREIEVIGRDQRTNASKLECCQGVLRVDDYGPDGKIYRSETYPTPLKLGLVRIVSVNGTRVALAPYGAESPDNVFVFDLTSRSWLVPRANATTSAAPGPVTCFVPREYTYWGDHDYFWPYGVGNCWTGSVDGKVVGIAAGHKRVRGYNPDTSQGVLFVFEGPDFDILSDAKQIYPTPLKVGNVNIVLVDGPLIYLKSDDQKTGFVFDLASRQWITPSVTPTRTVNLTPGSYYRSPTPQSTQEAMERRRSAWQTAVAEITTVPTWEQGTKPEPVWRLQRLTCERRPPPGKTRYTTCWGGLASGAILSVRSLDRISLHDPSEGAIAVFEGIYENINVVETYEAPLRVGAVRIVSVEGSVLRIVSEDGQTRFAFDLATRQWLPQATGATAAPIREGLVSCSAWDGHGYYSCWQGMINGEIIRLQAGRERGGVTGRECCAGLLLVNSYNETDEQPGYRTYTTPAKVGALYIVSVEGTRVTLAAYDPAFKDESFVFDLATRQWVFGTPQQTPSASVSSLPTLSPAIDLPGVVTITSRMKRDSMHLQDSQITKRRRGTAVMLLTMVLLPMIAACTMGSETQIAPSNVGSVNTNQAVSPTETLAGLKQAFETHVAETREAYGAIVALTGVPSRTSGPPPTYPTYTPLLGMLGTEPDFSKNPKNPYISSSWRGWIDGGIVQVSAGSEGEARDPSQGIIIVDVWSTRSSDIYNTPQRMGPVRIVAVDGRFVTLIPADVRTPGVLLTPWATQTPGPVFVFDLATRQWVSGTPQPVPSTSVSPSPTLSPFSTMSPALSPIPSLSPLP